jgi:hypothetical protein
MKPKKLITLIVAACVFFAISCRTPQRLIEKAIKKDPKILNQYADSVFIYTDSIDTVKQEVIRYIESEPRIIERIIENRKEVKEKKIEARNERQETRQTEKTQRKSLVQDNKTKRKESKQDGKTDRTGIRSDQKVAKQEQKTNRSTGWWMFFVLSAFILGMITARVMAARMDWRNKVDR